MRGSAFDSAAVLEPTGRSADVGIDAEVSAAAEVTEVTEVTEDAVYPDEKQDVTDQSVISGASASGRREGGSRETRLDRGSRGRAVLVGAGVLALVLLIVAGASLFSRRSANSRLDSTREQVVAVARQEAVNLMSLSYNTVNADLKSILSLATGPLAEQFNSQRSTIGGFLAEAKSTSRADVQSAGLMSLGHDRATVLVSADATVTNNASTDAGMKNVVKHYRMAMKLQRVKGHWLVADVEFDGAAQ